MLPGEASSAPVRNKHPDHPILPGREEKFTVAGSAYMQICPSDTCTHLLIDEFLKRHILPVAARVPHVELDFFDRRHSLRNSIICLFHLREIGSENTSALDITEYELAAECGDPAVIREA